MRTLSYINCIVHILFLMCFLRTFGLELKSGDIGTLGSSVQEQLHRIVAPGTQIEDPDIITSFTATNRQAGEISKKKCKAYSQNLKVISQTQAPSLGDIIHSWNSFICQFNVQQPLILGGTPAARHEFPHMVVIGYTLGEKIVWACGGSLISENYVLTASHCLKHKQLGLAKLIRIGMTNLSDPSGMQERTISEVWYNPDYKSSAKYNDIGLLKLSNDVDLGVNVRPACLHTTKISTEKAIATGWGNIGFTIPGGSNILVKIVLDFFDNESCNETYKKEINKTKSKIKEGILDDLMVCAGSHTEFKTTCQGDSGGPLQVYSKYPQVKCMYSIVGVTAFGKACGLAKDVPSVYTRVSHYIKWIEDVVWPEEN